MTAASPSPRGNHSTKINTGVTPTSQARPTNSERGALKSSTAALAFLYAWLTWARTAPRDVGRSHHTSRSSGQRCGRIRFSRLLPTIAIAAVPTHGSLSSVGQVPQRAPFAKTEGRIALPRPSLQLNALRRCRHPSDPHRPPPGDQCRRPQAGLHGRPARSPHAARLRRRPVAAPKRESRLRCEGANVGPAGAPARGGG